MSGQVGSPSEVLSCALHLGFNGIRTHELEDKLDKLVCSQNTCSNPVEALKFFRPKICNFLNCKNNWDNHISFSSVFPQFKSASFHISFLSRVKMKSINWSTPNTWVIITQLVEHCSANVEAMGSNPVEVLKLSSVLCLFVFYQCEILSTDTLRIGPDQSGQRQYSVFQSAAKPKP